MNRLVKGMVIITICLWLSACGQRGPLQLPEQPPENQPSPPKVDSVSLLETH